MRVRMLFQKPVSTELLLKKIKELLKQQEEDRKYSEKKMTEYIETRVKELIPAQAAKARE